MADRQTRRRRLEAAGYASLSGWIPKAEAGRVMQQVEKHREDVDAIMKAPPRPRGRPRSDKGKE